jgi:protein phosphatase-4 regulatory subunit 3
MQMLWRAAWRDANFIPQEDSKIFVESEDQPERMLLETKISKDDGYQKQAGDISKPSGLETRLTHK